MEEKGKRKAEWQNNYISRTYDRINLTVLQGQKDVLKEVARAKDNGSVNAFINRAISKLIEEEHGVDWKM